MVYDVCVSFWIGQTKTCDCRDRVVAERRRWELATAGLVGVDLMKIDGHLCTKGTKFFHCHGQWQCVLPLVLGFAFL